MLELITESDEDSPGGEPSSYASFSRRLARFVDSQAPRIALISIITNSIVVAVLAQKNMRNPTNMILGASALADLLNPLVAWPVKYYLFTFGRSYKYAEMFRCSKTYIIMLTFSEIFHTTSIWLTVLLAGQRYICLRHPGVYRKW